MDGKGSDGGKSRKTPSPQFHSLVFIMSLSIYGSNYLPSQKVLLVGFRGTKTFLEGICSPRAKWVEAC